MCYESRAFCRRLISNVDSSLDKERLLVHHRSLLLAVAFLLVVAVLLLPGVNPKAHAAGVVCLNDPSSAAPTAPCPTPATSLNGPSPNAALNNPIPVGSVRGPTQIRVGVYLSGVDRTNGFDITVLANRTVLTPYGIDLAGSILPSPVSIIVECVGGSRVIGPICLATDTTDTIQLAASGAPGALSTATTGLLFTAIYNITATTPKNGIGIGFQTGCGDPSNPTSDPPVCVTITNGGSVAVSETVATIGFNNSVDPSWVAISTPSASTYTFLQGTASPVAQINATAENGWPGLVGTDSISFTSIQSAGLTVSFTGAATTCSTGAPVRATCGVSASFSGNPGTYFVTFYGTYVYSNDTTLSNDGTLAGTVSLVVNIQDFTVSVSPSSLAFLATQNVNATVTLTSLGGFSGGITLSASTPSGLVAVFSPSFVQMTSSPLTSKVTFSSSKGGIYTVTVHATNSTSVKNSNLVTVRVQDFTISASSTNILLLSVGATAKPTITVAPLGGFSGTVTLSANPSSGLTASLDKISLPGGSGTSTLTVSSLQAGNYTVVVTGISGVLNHPVIVSVNVVDFTLTVTPTLIGPLPKDASANSTITLTPLNGFQGNVAISYSSSSSSLKVSLNATSITNSGSVLLTVTGTFEGNYTVTVTTVSGSLTHSRDVTVRISGFNVVATPGQFTILINSPPVSSTISVQSVNGFVGNVTFSLGSAPDGLIPSLSRTSLFLGPNQSNSTVLQITVGGGLLPGSYALDVNFASGTIVSGLQIIVNVPTPDFTVSTNQNSVLLSAGNLGTSTISVSFFYGFNGTVTLSASSPSGFTCSLSATSIPAGTSTTSTLSCSGSSAGFFNVTVTGLGNWRANSSPISRKTLVEFDNQDFTINLVATSIVANAGSPAHVKITIAAVGASGWSGNVNLSVSASSGLNAVLSAATISRTGTVDLDVKAATGGSYTLTVTGTSGSLSHTSQTLTVSVTEQASPSTILGLDPLIFYSIIGVLVALVAGSIAFARSRRGKKKK